MLYNINLYIIILHNKISDDNILYKLFIKLKILKLNYKIYIYSLRFNYFYYKEIKSKEFIKVDLK